MIFLGGFRLVFPRHPWRGKHRTRNTTFGNYFIKNIEEKRKKKKVKNA